MPICPFISGVVADSVSGQSSSNLVECITSQCRIWDTNKNECSIKLIYLAAAHIHNQHMHQGGHECNQGYILDCGPPFSPQKMPAVMKLTMEFMNREDQDGISVTSLQTLNPEITGSIYGVDFMIEENESCPPALKSIHSSPDFPVTPLPTITWEQYQSLLD